MTGLDPSLKIRSSSLLNPFGVIWKVRPSHIRARSPRQRTLCSPVPARSILTLLIIVSSLSIRAPQQRAGSLSHACNIIRSYLVATLQFPKAGLVIRTGRQSRRRGSFWFPSELCASPEPVSSILIPSGLKSIY